MGPPGPPGTTIRLPQSGPPRSESTSLFVQSTISKDDTIGGVAKEAKLLAGAHRPSDNLPPAAFRGTHAF